MDFDSRVYRLSLCARQMLEMLGPDFDIDGLTSKGDTKSVIQIIGSTDNDNPKMPSEQGQIETGSSVHISLLSHPVPRLWLTE